LQRRGWKWVRATDGGGIDVFAFLPECVPGRVWLKGTSSVSLTLYTAGHYSIGYGRPGGFFSFEAYAQ
jgi:hypothetical protein